MAMDYRKKLEEEIRFTADVMMALSEELQTQYLLCKDIPTDQHTEKTAKRKTKSKSKSKSSKAK
jgi:hypothetical protein